MIFTEIVFSFFSLALEHPLAFIIIITIINILLIDHSTGLITALYRRYIRNQYFKQSITKGDVNFAQRVKTLTASLGESVTLIGQMQAEIEARQALIDELAANSKTYKKLMELDQDEIEAVIQVLRSELSHENKKSFKIDLIKDVGLFLLGVAISLFIR